MRILRGLNRFYSLEKTKPITAALVAATRVNPPQGKARILDARSAPRVRPPAGRIQRILIMITKLKMATLPRERRRGSHFEYYDCLRISSILNPDKNSMN